MIEQKKSESFALIIDKDRDFLLNIMYQASMDGGLQNEIDWYNLKDTLDSFILDMVSGSKKVTWCNNPECRNKEDGKCEHKI